MNGSPPATSAYRHAALIPIALFFVVAAPFYWRVVEQPNVPGGNPGVNAPLFDLDAPPGALLQPLYLPFHILEPPTALAWTAALSIALAGIGMAAFLLGKGVRGSAACYGAVVYAFGGFAAGMMSRPMLACDLAWAPWALTAAHALARQPNAPRALMLGLLFALAGSWPAMGLGVLVGLFSGLHEPREWQRTLMKRAGWLLAAVALGFVLGIAALWPFQQFHTPMAAFLPRSPGDILPQLTAAATNDLPHAAYLGIAALLVAPAALTRRGAALFIPLYAAGWAGALYGYPPGGWLFIAALCGAAIAGLGADALLAPTRDWRSPFFYLPLTGAIAIGVVLILLGDAPTAGRTALLLLPIFASAFLRTPWVTVAATVLLTLITTIDLAAANRNRFPHPYFQASPSGDVHARQGDSDG